ncbi:unnamed protein product [Rotaria sp. Silwood1]|nr:unnamed protein product [Rotaria sp. Silwood1]CAF3500037.1 unnamed protein product [Rotaria sp. Silwood1]CAF3505922.1 unnamed protein product [Rotaria sp. Silwood1]CAF3508593.1 unnamed protein product [Rotaria sp. Silwood1]CAF4782916.1 unnamed protein product [Rotaria sp. Silwood1]
MEEQQPLQIICLQTSLTQYHYQSYAILKQYFLERIHLSIKPTLATNNILFNGIRAQHPTLVILPECTGTWLYLMCVPMPQYLRNFFFNYQTTKINRHILFMCYTLLTHIRLFVKEIDKNYHSKFTWLGLIKRSWFSLFADQTYNIYTKLFSELACETNCTIVAGSTFMYENINKNNFYNMSYVFEPNYGSICIQSGKQYPVYDEISFIDNYQKQPSIYSIPNTNIDIAILICADSWMPQVYEQYNRKELFNSNRRFLFIIISLNIGEWNIPWPGYDRQHDTPKDVNNKHIKTYSLSNAWFHYAIHRGIDILNKRNDLLGYGVICCQGILNIMNDIQAQGESMIVLKRSENEKEILYEAKTYKDEKILICEF